MEKIKFVAIASLLVGLLMMTGCVSAGVDVGGHGVGAGVGPVGAGVDVH